MVDSRLSRMAEKRALWVRTNNNLILNSPDGWVSNQIVPMPWGAVQSGSSDPPTWWLGSDKWGGAIGPNGPDQASVLPAITRCVEVITGVLVRTKWRYTDSNGDVFRRPLWIDDPMGVGRMPGPISGVLPAGMRMDGGRFFSTWVAHALLWGRGVFVCVEDAEGQPTPGSLRLLNPYMVDVDDAGHWVIDPNGETPIRTNFDGRFIMGGRVWRLVVLHGLSPNDGRTPEGVLVRHWETFRIGAAVSKYVASTFEAGVPAGFLKVSSPGMKQEEADTLRASWIRAHGAGRRSIAVLSSTVDFQRIGLSPVDTAAEEMHRANLRDVALAFNLDPIFVGEGTGGMTYNNNSDRRRDLVDISLANWTESLTATLTAVLPYGQRVDIDWATFTQPSIEVHVPALVQAVQSGMLTGSEARAYLGVTADRRPDPAWRDISPAANPQESRAGGDDARLD